MVREDRLSEGVRGKGMGGQENFLWFRRSMSSSVILGVIQVELC